MVYALRIRISLSGAFGMAALLILSLHFAIIAFNVAGYLAGVAKEPFDWDFRPLFLRLGVEETDADREVAFRELCALVAMEPETR